MLEHLARVAFDVLTLPALMGRTNFANTAFSLSPVRHYARR